MTRIRRINVSQVEGDGADNTSIDEIRPFGETAFYLDNNGKLTLMIFDGVRNHRDSKVLSPGVLYGSNSDAGDGSGSDTIKLIPDASLGTEQYIVVDPTGGEPGHIHLRAGGVQDSSSADLYIGGEQTFVRVSDTNDNVVIRTSILGEGITPNSWTFDNIGNLTLPNSSQIRVDGNNVEVGGMTNFNVEALGVVNVYTNDGAHQWQFDDDGSLSVPGSIKNTQTLGGEVVISTASAQGDTAKTWTFSHDGVGNLGLPQESGVSAVKSMNLSTYSPTFQQFVNLKDYDSLSSVDGTDINIINPQPEILALIDPTSPNFIGTAGAKVRIVHGYSLGDFIVTETTLTGPFALNGEDPLVPGVPRYTATIADTGVAASEIRQFGFGDSATWHFKSNGILKLPGGATVKDLLGEGPDDSVLILGAGTTIAENQRAARIGINGSVEGVSIGAGSNDWSFTNDGNLTIPGGISSTDHLNLDADYDGGYSVYIGSNHPTAGMLGGVVLGDTRGGFVQVISQKLIVGETAVPTHSTGAVGDVEGQVAFDSNYIYYCFANFGTAPTETFTVVNVGEFTNTISVNIAANPNYTVPQAGWYVVIGGVTMTLTAFSGVSGSNYNFIFDNPSGVALPSTVTLTSNTGYTNIWKRIAWSGGTW